MAKNYLDFERPIGELASKIQELRQLTSDADINIAEEIEGLEESSIKLTNRIFSRLTPWQKTQLSRHPDRPYTSDYIHTVFSDFLELHGDRVFSDDLSVIGGLADINGMDIMLIGLEKGRGTKEKVSRNFGMPHPEGYRKALRLMKLAEKFRLPIVTLIDTPGAYPGREAEERGQAEAIARNLREMVRLTVPVISVVIGEGGSGGALAVGIGNRILMLQYAIYSVISPEGCASILWKDAAEAPLASEALRLTADEALDLKVIDEIIPEPTGGAHRNLEETGQLLKKSLVRHLRELGRKKPENLAQERYEKFMEMGEWILESSES